MLPKVEIDESVISSFNERSKELGNYKRDFNNIISLLNLRSLTLAKIATYMVSKQSNYIQGKSKTKSPLSLKEISEFMNVSVSSCSRIVNTHYATYNGKTFLLKSLLAQFANGKNTRDEVMLKIKEIIENTDKNPSDEKIKNELSEKYDIKIARRTVQKYRSLLNINSSYKREK